MAVEPVPRLLVLRALGIGDLLTAVPALRALAVAFPGHERLLAAPGALRGLVELIDARGGPAIHRVADVGERERLPWSLHGADVAVNLHGRGPQSHRILGEARPRRAIWFENPVVAQSTGSPGWRPHEHETVRWCRLLEESGMPADPTALGLRPPPGPPPDGVTGATVVHPGAASGARRWPVERFAQVARAEAQSGRHVVVTGTRGELPLARRVARDAGLRPESVLAGRTDLGGLARVVAAAGRVVCGDTGVGHLATAFGTPSVLLFGPTPPAEWGPPLARPRHVALWSGRRGDPHSARPDPGLLEITVDQVLGALERVGSAPVAAGVAA